MFNCNADIIYDSVSDVLTQPRYTVENTERIYALKQFSCLTVPLMQLEFADFHHVDRDVPVQEPVNTVTHFHCSPVRNVCKAQKLLVGHMPVTK